MNRRSSAVVLAVIGVVVVVLVWLLATGGGTPSSSDATGDVKVGKGANPPEDTSVADLLEADVVVEDAEVVFEATVDTPIPKSLDERGLTFRWELTTVEDEEKVIWIVMASVDMEATASVVATQFDYSSTTIDDTLPGTVKLDGSTVRITLEPKEIPEFPEEFMWSVSTTLDGDRARATSATAVDNVPDEGSLRAAS